MGPCLVGVVMVLKSRAGSCGGSSGKKAVLLQPPRADFDLRCMIFPKEGSFSCGQMDLQIFLVDTVFKICYCIYQMGLFHGGDCFGERVSCGDPSVAFWKSLWQHVCDVWRLHWNRIHRKGDSNKYGLRMFDFISAVKNLENLERQQVPMEYLVRDENVSMCTKVQDHCQTIPPRERNSGW